MNLFSGKYFQSFSSKKNDTENKNIKDRVVIVGAGQVGIHIMERLAEEGYNVVLIDENEEMVVKSREIADVASIVGNGCNPKIYEEINLSNKDLFVAVTDSDETNLIACNIAQAFGCETKIARVRKPFYKVDNNSYFNNQFWKKMGIEVLFNQDILTIEEIDHLIENPGAIDTVFLNNDLVQIVGYKVKANSLLIGRRLIGIRDVPIFEHILVVAINTGENQTMNYTNKILDKFKTADHNSSQMIIPRGDYKIKEGDLLYLAGKRNSFSGISYLFDPKIVTEFNRIFILGGSILSHNLAEHLQKKYNDKKIFLIEKTKKGAYIASETLNPKINVLFMNAQDIESLKQEGMDRQSIFIAISPDEDENVLSSLVIKEDTMARTIAMAQSSIYSHLIQYLDIDAAVSPKSLIVEDVLKALRKNVYDVLSAKGHDAEILEFVVPQQSLMVNQQLRDIRFPANAIIAFIFRQEEIIVPRGDAIIKSDDHLVIFCLKSAISDIQNLFKDN